MQIGFLMDPLETIKPNKDTTLAMIHSAQQRGWRCWFFTPKDLFCREGEAFAQATELQVDLELTDNWAKIIGAELKLLSSFDLLLMRKDPPFDLEYIYATYALNLAEKSGVLVANNPQSLRDANEKFFILNFPQCCPNTLVTKDIERLKAFWQEHQRVVYKPLEGMGGNAIFYVDEQAHNLPVILELLTKKGSRTIMAQTYIPAIKTGGDKRILLINGEPVPYGLARIPKDGEIRGNLAAGASGEVVEITARDRWICQQIAPKLKEMGLYFVGIDIIGDFLTEINVTSPTCLREIEAETQLDIAGSYLDFLSSIAQK